MSTKIELEYPYNKDWRFGYVVVNPEGRETLILYNGGSDRSSTQYARYLLAVKIGRYLTDGEQVDHIDNNKFNNDVSNLQILSPRDNHHKTHKTGETMLEHICPVCGIVFKLTATKSHRKKPFCCSKACGYIKGAKTAKENRLKTKQLCL